MHIPSEIYVYVCYTYIIRNSVYNYYNSLNLFCAALFLYMTILIWATRICYINWVHMKIMLS